MVDIHVIIKRALFIIQIVNCHVIREMKHVINTKFYNASIIIIMFNQTFQLGAFTPHREFLLELCHLLFNGKQVQISVVQ